MNVFLVNYVKGVIRNENIFNKGSLELVFIVLFKLKPFKIEKYLTRGSF